MTSVKLKNCPGTLAEGFDAYSKTCLNRMFNGKKVNPILPYDSPAMNEDTDERFAESRTSLSISGVQEKFPMLLDKNRLRLAHEGERATYILKPIPAAGKQPDQMPANEHLTMQIARQAYEIETAENALVFFKNGTPAYLTKRFDIKADGNKWAQDDFASLAGRTPQTHGEHYKYQGNYLAMFRTMESALPAYKAEAPKLLKLLLFNYLFSNGDAHYKNFSILETALGDYRLSPAYDLLNSRLHVQDTDFALEDGLLPKSLSNGKISQQFALLAREAGISEKSFLTMMTRMLSQTDKVTRLIALSFLADKAKRNYLQAYQGKLKQLLK